MQFSYADGIANIQLVDGVVRFDLVSITEVKKEGASVRPVQQVAMSMQGFLRMQAQLNQVIEKLLEQGVIKKLDDVETKQD